MKNRPRRIFLIIAAVLGTATFLGALQVEAAGQTTAISPPLAAEAPELGRSSRFTGGGAQTGTPQVRSTESPELSTRPNGRG